MNKKKRFTRTVKVTGIINTTPEGMWKEIEDVSGYVKYAKYMKKAWLRDTFKEGGSWVDISTVVYVPLLITHKIIELKKGRKAVFLINLPFGGTVVQSFEVKKEKTGVELTVIAEINWNNWLLDLILGKFLEQRTRVMLEGSMENARRLFA